MSSGGRRLVPVVVMLPNDSTVHVFNSQNHAILSKLIFGFSLRVQKTNVGCYTTFSFVVL